MFPVRSLLQHVHCPDQARGTCDRPACPFGHARPERTPTGKRRASQMEEHSESSSKAVRQAEADRRSILSANVRAAHDAEPGSLLASSSGLARAVEQRRGPRNAYAAVKGPAHQTSAGSAHPTRADEQDKGSSETQSSSSGGGVAASPGLASALDGRPSAAQSLGVLTAPSIVRQSHPAASKVPYATRQGSLRTYFTSFNSLYAPLLPPSPTSKERSPSSVQRAAALLKRVIHRMASEDALASESKIFKMSNTNPMTYRNSVRTDLVGIARRQKEDRLALSDNKTCIGQLGIDIFQRATSLNDEGNVLDEHGKKKIIEKLEEDLISLLRQSELIGTPEEVKVKLALLQERKQGRLDVERLEKAGMLSSKETLKQSDYPWPEAREGESAQLADEELSSDTQDLILQHWGMGGTQPDLVGHETNCERCGNRFVVKPIEPDSADTEACSFHWGKRRFVRDGGGMRGPRVPRWTCCNALDEGSAFSASSLTSVAKEAGFAAASSGSSAAAQGTGCIKGPHVFKEEQANLLHRRAAFLSTEALLSQPPKAEQRGSQGGKHQILAFDCELIYTTAGMSLARLTVLDESGKSVLDRYVRPRAAILDYNTR